MEFAFKKLELILQKMNSTANYEIYPGVLSPRESAKWIVDNTDSKLIRIEQKAVEKVAEMICHSTADQLKQLEFSACEVQPKNADQAAIDWIFFIDSINFSFWSDQSGGHYFVTHNGKTYSGYFAVCAALNRALERGLPLTSAEFMAEIDEKILGQCLQGDNGVQIPMLAERVEIIRENGKILKEKFDGSFLNCLIQSNGNAQKLLQLIVENFPNFRDFAVYKGKNVSFLKRAQILVADIHNCLGAAKNELNIGKFEDISSLTMFADYRVPQALAYLGVLEYSPMVIDRLKLDELLKNGCELEVQLRAFSIRACDAILESIQKLVKSPHFSLDSSNLDRLRQFCAVNVDVWIWLWRRQNSELIEKANVPFHRCRSIFY